MLIHKLNLGQIKALPDIETAIICASDYGYFLSFNFLASSREEQPSKLSAQRYSALLHTQKGSVRFFKTIDAAYIVSKEVCGDIRIEPQPIESLLEAV